MARNVRTDFIIRILIATVLMGAGAWYLGSLWNARMREQNLILIAPVVALMVPFYLAVLVHEYRRYRKEMRAAAGGHERAAAAEDPAVRQAKHAQIAFMAVAAASIPAFYLVGAIPATILLIVSGLLVLGVRRPLVLVCAPLIVTFSLWIVFIQLFGIRMPLFPSL